MASALEAVIAAREDLKAAQTTRFRFSMAMTWPDDVPRPRNRLVRLAMRLGGRFSRFTVVGLLDVSRRRYLATSGSEAVLHADGLVYKGKPGTPLEEGRRDRGLTPLWMVDLLAGVTAAADLPTVGADLPREVEASVDFGRAADASPSFHLPGFSSTEDWRARPVRLRIADGRLMSIEYAKEDLRQTLELHDFGVSLDDVDWSRLPDVAAL